MPTRIDKIDYDALQQEALRGVVRAALKLAAANGLPGDHHFFITFRTTAPGVTRPGSRLARYPDEMSIILQNEYWDLVSGETFFGDAEVRRPTQGAVDPPCGDHPFPRPGRRISPALHCAGYRA